MVEPEPETNLDKRFNVMIVAEEDFQTELDELVHFLFGTGIRIEDGFERIQVYGRTLKKNKTIFWIKVLENTFIVAFWFGDKLESAILESNLPDNLKTGFINAQKYGKIRSIYIDIQDSNDIENVKKLINLKLNNK